jgi:thioredoxin reductase
MAISVQKPGSERQYDVAIVGGGAAGLSAALLMARCCRKVVIFDDGKQRNRFASHIHGFLTRDGSSPAEFYRLVDEELRTYPQIERVAACVKQIENCKPFRLGDASGKSWYARRVILACGVYDKLPNMPGFQECYGRTVHHCPYCDAYEYREKPIALYGRGNAVFDQALILGQWSKKILVIDDANDLSSAQLAALGKRNIEVKASPISELLHSNGKLTAIAFADGERISAEAMFFTLGSEEKSELAEQLRCQFRDNSGIETDGHRETCVPGVFAAGDILREDVQFVVFAAAQGAAAAVRANKSLIEEDLQREGITLTKHDTPK